MVHLTKKCCICTIEKSVNLFWKSRHIKDGFYSSCKICSSQYSKSWKLLNPVLSKAKDKRGYSKSKGKLKETRKKRLTKEYYKKLYEHQKIRKSKDIQFKIRKNLRNRFSGQLKNGSSIKDLGCTILELRVYLEAKFQTDMTWNNNTRNGWHIDHILPLSSFDLTNREEFRKAVHYTNLQPLWAKDNIKKGNNIL